MPETELPCPQCATLLAETATFCVACGAVLEPSWNKTRALPAGEKAPAPAAPPAVPRPAPAPTPAAPKPSPAPRPSPPRSAPRATVPPGSRALPARKAPSAPGPGERPPARLTDLLAPLGAGILALATFAGGVHYLATTHRHERVATAEGTPAPSPPSPLPSARPSPTETAAPGPSPSPSPRATPAPSPSPATPTTPVTPAASPTPEPAPAPDAAATTSVTPPAARPEPSPPPSPEPAPAPPDPDPEPAPSPSPAIDDARVWDGHVWRPTERGHKHGPHCGHYQVSGRWSLFANEPREYDGDLEDFQKKTPENGVYDFRGKTYWLPDHVHSDHCIHKLGAYGWYLPEPETTPAPAPSPAAH